MKLHTLKPAENSVKSKKRIGRGTGSGMGGTSTRGHKGAGSRSGNSTKRGFEGGQMPLQRRIPKFGFKSINRVEYKPINLDTIQQLLETHKVSVIDIEFLKQHGLISGKDLVKVLGRGEVKTAAEIKVHAFSSSAVAAIEKVGGKATVL
ncbi:50S ribosomal protein L15 [Cytophagaceae bacterium DM2B3-1]|uniref:Large ribosomal subunit protein uL15 n=1 Tax=Xanthocytophaga flava TaxID=3048013 RepID=A0AAE3QH91_9BACT|nr:50S ribosomal protein L15 [Xanthocytophaga flavus]MDJ1466699.1 50S ribosomal protein L15 [Xanthocytophaga flavus]MDJ1479352.1 50S ribosomal protein L15 [Xanthocytophaga flavus]MDJ1492695.1 50S ribosomal protein L15 [Xanthocytophaga flavus]